MTVQNPLEALLGTKSAKEITEQVYIKRLDTNFTIKALTGADIEGIRQQATRPVRNGKKYDQVVNEAEVSQLLVAKATIEPDFKNADLMKHYEATDAGECVQNALLAGEIIMIQQAILELSGFGDMDEEIGEVKN